MMTLVNYYYMHTYSPTMLQRPITNFKNGCFVIKPFRLEAVDKRNMKGTKRNEKYEGVTQEIGDAEICTGETSSQFPQMFSLYQHTKKKT